MSKTLFCCIGKFVGLTYITKTICALAHNEDVAKATVLGASKYDVDRQAEDMFYR